MKIGVSAIAQSLDAHVDPRFGRCQFFIIVDSETMKFEAVSNSASAAMHGAGIQAAQIMVNKGVQVVLTGNVGPNAFQTLSAAGIKVVTGISSTVKNVVEKYKTGEFKEVNNPTVSGHSGMGGRRGRMGGVQR